MAKTKSIWPRVPAPFVQAVLAGHSSLGLAFAALIYLVCFSGTVAVLVHEFERWETPRYASAERAPADRTPAEAAVAATRDYIAAYPEAEHLYVSLPDGYSPRTRLYGVMRDDSVVEGVADRNGTWLGETPAPWSRFMLELHTHLHVPGMMGQFIVGMTGVALLSLLISGLLAHPRIFRDAFHIRLGGSKRLQEADLHNRAGIWGLPFHIVIALSGALLGLTTVIAGTLALAFFKGDINQTYDLFLSPAPEDDPRPAPLPDFDAILADALAADPAATLRQVRVDHPGETGQAVYVALNHPGTLAYGDSYTYNGEGERIHTDTVADAPLGTKILQIVGPYHFGWFGGWPSRIAYVLLGAALTWVTSTGVSIWLERRRSRGRPAPVTERLWAATVWSQPVAYAVSAMAALISPASPVLLIWLTVSLACFAVAVPVGGARLSQGLRLAGAVSLCGVVLIHIVTFGPLTGDPAVLALNLGILACAALMAASVTWKAASGADRSASQGSGAARKAGATR